MNDVWTDGEDWVVRRAPETMRTVAAPTATRSHAEIRARSAQRAAKEARRANRSSRGKQTLRRRRR